MSATDNPTTTTQAGICSWSPHEKNLLFKGIANYGQDNLSAISALIGSKSEPQVHVYVQSLKMASVKQYMYGKRQSLVGIADMPAAVEISEECCASLDQVADSLAMLQQRHEEHSEKERHCDLWKLDQDKAQWVERRLCESEEGKAEIREKLPAAELLKLEEMLKLSCNFFMNKVTDRDNNWRSICSRGERPALLYTAFSDLYDIAVSITSRLIQTSLFFAMSRLRAAKSSNYTPQQAVKHCDVLAALKVLQMKESPRDVWVPVARRYKLNVYDQALCTSSKRRKLDYSEVERVLGGYELLDKAKTKQKSGQDDDHDPSEGAITETESVFLEDTDTDSYHSSIHSSTTTDHNAPADKIGKRTDEYLRYIDQQASKKEEAWLWKMLGKDPPSMPLTEKPTKIENPGPHRHDRNDLDDWRLWVNLKPEWDIYDLGHLQAGRDCNPDQAQLEENVLPEPALSSNHRHFFQQEHRSQSETLSASNQQSVNQADTRICEVDFSTNEADTKSEKDQDDMDSEGPERNSTRKNDMSLQDFRVNMEQQTLVIDSICGISLRLPLVTHAENTDDNQEVKTKGSTVRVQVK
ncbi:MAG: hypothetical protein Q9213_001460 [Squamulea squamosa]